MLKRFIAVLLIASLSIQPVAAEKQEQRFCQGDVVTTFLIVSGLVLMLKGIVAIYLQGKDAEEKEAKQKCN